MSSSVSQQTFFSEDNLFLLLNIIHDTIDDPNVFDSSSSNDRQKLFEIMASVYRSNRDKTLPDINKLVLRNTYIAVRQSNTPSTIDTRNTNTDVSKTNPSMQSIRDVDVNQRTPPVHFAERPQQAFVHKQASDATSLDTAMQALQTDRHADIQTGPDTIDFRLADNDEEDNQVVLSRLQAIEASRKLDESKEKEQPEMSLADAMQSFEHTKQQMDAHVDEASVQKREHQATQEAVFRQNTQLYEQTQKQDSVVGGQSIDVHRYPEFETVLAKETDRNQTDTLSKLDDDVKLSQDIVRSKMDESTFQQALHMAKEEDALHDQFAKSTQGEREELLIAPRNQFLLKTHHMEICSNDRVRTLPMSENADTPYSFTLYFNSNRRAYRVYPIYESHPIEDPDEYAEGDTECTIKLDTLNVRQCAGLRGYPVFNMPVVGSAGPLQFNTSGPLQYDTVQLSDVAGPNVDTVFYNVVSIQTNHVQIYYPHDYAPKYPYIVLEITQFTNIYKSSNTLLRKSFCKLFYDRSSSPTLSNSQYHLYTPLNQEKKNFSTPLASIDRLTFKLYNSFGNPLDTIQDVLRVKALYIDLTLGSESIYILLHDYIPESYVSVNNHITFEKCLEWYNKSWFDNWNSTEGAEQKSQQTLVEKEYYDKLCANRGADNETLQKMKDEFSRKQVRFHYPTTGYPVERDFAEFRDYLQRDVGHKVVEVGKFSPSPVFTLNSSVEYINAIRIQMPTTLNKETGDTSVIEFGGDNATFITKLHSADYPLMTGTLLNNSVCTNISMSIITREEDNQIMSQNV